MNKDNLDGETKAQLGRAAEIEAMLGSAGWQYAEEELQNTIKELRDVRSIDTNGDVTLQLKVNQAIAESFELWLEELKSQVNNAIIMKGNDFKSPLVERR